MKNKNEVLTTPKTVVQKGAPLGPKATKKLAEESSGGGNINLNTRLWLSDDSDAFLSTLPKQLRSCLKLIVNEFEGNCTLGQLDEAWQKSKYLDVNGGPYTQGVKARTGQGSFWTHYISGTEFKSTITTNKKVIAFGLDNISKYFKIAD
tara:strand:+ start:84 stop:530 length:447 start_codon:yes stop_codon:yes gene_type:complete